MQIQESRPKWGILIVLFLVLGALAAVPFFLVRSRPKIVLPPYEIQNFIGKAEIYSGEQRAWIPAQRSMALKAGDKIRTGADSEIDIRVPDQIRIRIKQHSEAEVTRPKFFEQAAPRYRLHLVRGSLLGSTEKEFKGKELNISTPVLVAAVLGTSFFIESHPEKLESSVRVLQGSVTVKSIKANKSVVVKSLEITRVKGSAPPLQPVRVSRDEWNQLKEAYELIQKSAAVEAKQLDFSKEAGSFFQYVFDHGTFYTQNFGFADREFVKDEATAKTRMQASYDVFPNGSFVGVYMKTRNLDISHFKAIQFEVRGDPEEGYPDSFKIELKSGAAVVRSFVPRDFKEKWQKFEYPIRFTRQTPLTEVTLVFANEKVGTHKKGVLHMQDVNLVPQDPALIPKAGPEKKKPTPKVIEPDPASSPV